MATDTQSKGAALVKKWEKRIENERKAHDKYRKQAKDSEEAARDDRESKAHSFNIHWANCKIVRSAIYASRPKPDVRRRFQKADPEEKELAKLVERGLEYQLDTGAFDTPSVAVVRDFVVAGLGIPRVIYNVETAPVPDPIEPEAQMMAAIAGEDIEPTFDQGLEEIVSQSVEIKHWPRKHFGWEPGHPDWNDVGWIYFESFPSRAEIKREYGVEVKASSDESAEQSEAVKAGFDEVRLIEIWDKRTRQVIVIAQGHDEPLEARKDELELQDFFPIPRPAFDNLKSDELIPKPDYCFVRNAIASLQRLTARRDNLVKQIKAVRLYDAALAEAMGQLESAGDTANIPVKNLLSMLDSADGKANFDRVLAELPMRDRIEVVRELTIQIEAVKQEIYEVIGISDIIRGSTQASETATAQNIKGQWANVRLNDKTSEINRLFRDVLRIMAEIMCEHFTPEQLYLMTGVEPTERMMQMARSDIGRQFAIDIETDSTILKDDQEERAQKLEMVNVLLEKLQLIIPAVQAQTLPAELLQEILLFSISSYKHGKQLEDAITELGPQLANLQSVQQFQAQVMQLSEQLQATQQQAGAQIQDLQGQLAQVDANEQRIKEVEATAKADLNRANANKIQSEADAQRIENDIVRSGIDQILDIEQKRADVEKTVAETDKIRKETQEPQVVNG